MAQTAFFKAILKLICTNKFFDKCNYCGLYIWLSHYKALTLLKCFTVLLLQSTSNIKDPLGPAQLIPYIRISLITD